MKHLTKTEIQNLTFDKYTNAFIVEEIISTQKENVNLFNDTNIQNKVIDKNNNTIKIIKI